MKPQVKKILFHFLIVSLFSLIVFLVVSAILDDKNSSSNIFTITWKNYDGTIIYQEELEKGSMPQYSGNTPKRISDSNADYYFSGWIPSIQEVSSDMTYVAEYVLDYKGTGLVSSHESGFYDGEFDLSLYSADNTTIYYTLDSTNPTTSSTIYDTPIKIEDNSGQPNVFANISGISANDVYMPNHLVDKCVVLKAVAVNDEGVSSDVVTKTFFINYNKKNGYDNLPIISMIVEHDDLFDYETGIYVTGKVYDESEHKGYPEQYPANYNQKGREWERKADFLYFDEDKSFSFDQTIGIRIHGGWSRIFNQKSFNLYARKEYSGSNSFEKPFFDTTKLQTCMLRSGGYRDIYSTKTRDVLNQELSKNESFAIQDGYPCILFLNGEYWGIYLLQERFTDNYVEEHYGIDKENIIIVNNDEIDEGIDSDISLYEELINFFRSNNFESDIIYNEVHKYIDVAEFASYMATELYIGNADWPGNNVAMWRAREISDKMYEDGKWHFMFFDTDDSAGMISKCNYDSDPFLNSKHWKYGPLDERSTLGLMLSKLLHNKNFKDLFVNTFNRVALENFSVDKVNEYLLNTTRKLNVPMIKFYQRFLSADEKKYNDEYFQSQTDVIKDFYSNRYEYAIKYLNEHLLEY